MDPNHYEFHSTWTLHAPRAAVLDVLGRVETYVEWWPEVRRITAIADDRAEFVIRSFLPYSLTFVGRRVDDAEAARDDGADVLELAMSGDLDGYSRFVVPPGAHVAHVRFDEVVDVRKPALRKVARLGRPLFAANHARMMRRGEAGLRARLHGPGRP